MTIDQRDLGDDPAPYLTSAEADAWTSAVAAIFASFQRERGDVLGDLREAVDHADAIIAARRVRLRSRPGPEPMMSVTWEPAVRGEP